MSVSMRARAIAGRVVSMLLTAPAATQVAPVEVAAIRGDPRAESVPRFDTAAAQLAPPPSLRSAMRGKEGDAKNASRRAAIDAYRAGEEYFSSDARACAEAGVPPREAP